MMWPRESCPTPIELERGFWSDDGQARSHAEACARCRPQWNEIAALVELGRAIPAPGGSERREEIRTTLLSKVRPERPSPRRLRRAAWVAPLAAAAAVAAVWWLWPSAGEPPAQVTRRGHVLEHAETRWLLASTLPDEIVRLVDGTITVEVAPLAQGERFRVITGDAEVEVRGTAFDVSARDDRLLSVRVMHGVVEVRAGTAAPVTLTAGQSWKPAQATAPAPSAGRLPGPEPLRGSPGAAPAAAPTPAAVPAPAPPSPPIAFVSPRPDAHAPAPPAVRNAAQQAFDDGWRAIRSGDFDDAAAAFERVAAAGDAPLAEDAAFWRAVALARAGRAVPAIRAFDAFLDAYPDSTRAGEASVMVGWLHVERGNRETAARRFRAAVDDRSPRVRESAAAGLKALETRP